MIVSCEEKFRSQLLPELQLDSLAPLSRQKLVSRAGTSCQSEIPAIAVGKMDADKSLLPRLGSQPSQQQIAASVKAKVKGRKS